MSFQPLGNRVLIEREEQTNQTASGLYIPDSAKEKPSEGKVVAVGKDAIEAGAFYPNQSWACAGCQYFNRCHKDY